MQEPWIPFGQGMRLQIERHAGAYEARLVESYCLSDLEIETWNLALAYNQFQSIHVIFIGGRQVILLSNGAFSFKIPIKRCF